MLQGMGDEKRKGRRARRESGATGKKKKRKSTVMSRTS